MDSASRVAHPEGPSGTRSPSTLSAAPCGACRVCTWAEHTTAASAQVGDAGGAACETRSSQDCRCLASEEEVELCEVMVLTGEDGEPLAPPGTDEE